jgi:hypothetical protein
LAALNAANERRLNMLQRAAAKGGAMARGSGAAGAGGLSDAALLALLDAKQVRLDHQAARAAARGAGAREPRPSGRGRDRELERLAVR